MSAAELLMSESQERMMAFVPPNLVDDVLAIATRWRSTPQSWGRPDRCHTDRASRGGDRGGGPRRLAGRRRTDLRPSDAATGLAGRAVGHRTPGLDDDPADVLVRLLDDPALGSTAWVHEQYDHMLFLNTVLGPDRMVP